MSVRAWRQIAIDDPGADEPRFEGDPQDLLDAASFVAELLHRPSWHADAACREHPEVTWFPGRGEPLDAARQICSGCLVRDECQSYALEQGSWLAGVWGGTSERQRRQLRRATALDAA